VHRDEHWVPKTPKDNEPRDAEVDERVVRELDQVVVEQAEAGVIERRNTVKERPPPIAFPLSFKISVIICI
jgi:hypothetical protein